MNEFLEKMRPAVAYTILVLAIAVVVAILASAIQTNKESAQRAKDLSLATAYQYRADRIERCRADNSAAVARIATAEAIVAIGAHANPAVPHDLRTQLLLAAYVKKVDAAIVKNNPRQSCSLPALDLPNLPPLTSGAKKILRSFTRRATTTSTAPPSGSIKNPTSGKNNSTQTTARAQATRRTTTTTQPGRSGEHRKHPKG